MTLAYILDHAVCCASAASSGRSLHRIISQLRMKYSSSNCPNHVRRTKSSIKKRIIVRRTVRSIFGEQTLRPIKNGLKRLRIRKLVQRRNCMHQVCRQWPQRALCMFLFGLDQGLKRTASQFLLFAVDYQHISFSQHQVEEEE